MSVVWDDILAILVMSALGALKIIDLGIALKKFIRRKLRCSK